MQLITKATLLWPCSKYTTMYIYVCYKCNFCREKTVYGLCELNYNIIQLMKYMPKVLN